MIWGKTSEMLGRATDYVFGRNTLIGVASLMLLIISGYATWHGMRDFIIGVSAAPAQPEGAMSVSTDVLVIAVVVALTFLMWLALRETFGHKRRLADRLVMLVMYIFLAIWSVGFGYGFWWSLISGEEATRTGLSGLQEDARDASGAVAARLDAVRSQLDNVVTWSESQMAREETSGGSCGTSSGAGRGPLYNARRSVRDSVTTLRDGMTRSWLEPVQGEVEQLRQSAASLEGGTVEERQRNFEAKASEIRGAARNIAARSNELGRSTAAEMRALAESVSVPPGQAGFACYDPTLAQRLRQAADQADQPVDLSLREAEFNEGPAGVANAVKNLWKNIGAYGSSVVTYVMTGEAPEQEAGAQGITGRDLIALLAAIGIDMGLLALAILNPPPAATLRPPAEVARQIKDAIETAIARAENAGVDIEWVRRHLVYHKQASYLVIPNLYAADPTDEKEAAKALAMNQLAGVLDDMDVVRWPKQKKKWLSWWPWHKSEIERLKEDEAGASNTDLTAIRKAWLEEHGSTDSDPNNPKDEAHRKATPLRNHGIFSKAERALTIAGWSEQARRDIEILVVVDKEGLTPLLMVLNEWEKEPSRPEAEARA